MSISPAAPAASLETLPTVRAAIVAAVGLCAQNLDGEDATNFSDAINDALTIAGADPLTEPTERVVTVGDALDALKLALKQDEGFAWAWQSNIAMPLQDAASRAKCPVSHRAANSIAAELMRHLFDVDVTKSPYFIDLMANQDRADELVGGPIVMGIDLSAEAMAELAAEAGRVDGVFVVAKAGAGITFVDHKLYTEEASDVRMMLAHRLNSEHLETMQLQRETVKKILDLLYPTHTPATDAPADAAEAKGVAIMKEAANSIDGMYAAIESTVKEHEAVKAIEPRPDLLDASPAPTKHYTFDEFVEYGREWCKANNHVLTGGMPWSFSFHGFAVSHEHDDLYLIVSTPGVTHHFNHGDEISVVPGLGFQIHSAARRTLGHPTGNRRVSRPFVAGDIVRVTAGELSGLVGEYLHTDESGAAGKVRLLGSRIVIVDSIDHASLEIAPMAEAAKVVGEMNRVEDKPQAAHDLIEPTIGRRVWFHPSPRQVYTDLTYRQDQAMDAGIVYVWNSRLVNLDVCDHDGRHHAFTSVQLVQPGDAVPSGDWCEWMPYQRGQASKGSK